MHTEQMSESFSDTIVYVDESGDHGLNSIDPSYPIFVLVFCIFHKRDYVQTVVPLIQEFKLKHFGHDQVILHKSDFLNELTDLVQKAPFTLISSVIDKQAYQ
ncbi:MAG: hypothetical protein Kow0065_13460 [Methylomicrobium sp.]